MQISRWAVAGSNLQALDLALIVGEWPGKDFRSH